MSTVSVVIPTRGRAKQVVSAVRSALAQTDPPLEVIVVIDGPDPETHRALAPIADTRVRVIGLEQAEGGGSARQRGVVEARGEWIAFLDDDDEWLTHKLERQLAEARSIGGTSPIVSSQVIARSPSADYIWPRNVRVGEQPISEYLFVRRGATQGEALLQTSTLLARRSLLMDVPFRGLKKHQDWDWVLRAAHHPGVALVIVPEPLAIWHIEETRPSLSRSEDWRWSLQWASDNHALFTPKAYAAFCLTVVGASGANVHSLASAAAVLRESIRATAPRIRDLMLFAGFWLVPPAMRRTVRRLLAARHR